MGSSASGSSAESSGDGEAEAGSDVGGSQAVRNVTGGDSGPRSKAGGGDVQGGNTDGNGAQHGGAGCSSVTGCDAGYSSAVCRDAGSGGLGASGRGRGSEEHSDAYDRTAETSSARGSDAGDSNACWELVQAGMAPQGGKLRGEAGAPLSTSGRAESVAGHVPGLRPGSTVMAMTSSCSTPAAPSAAAAALYGNAQGAALDCPNVEAGNRVMGGIAEPAWRGSLLAGAVQRAEGSSRAAAQHVLGPPLLPVGTTALPLPPVRALVPCGVGWSDSEPDSDGEHDARLEAKYGLCPAPDPGMGSDPASGSGHACPRSLSSEAGAGSLRSGRHARRPTQSSSSSGDDSTSGGGMGHSPRPSARQIAGRREVQPWSTSGNCSGGAQLPADSSEGLLRAVRSGRRSRGPMQRRGSYAHGSAAAGSESHSSQGAMSPVARPALAEPDLHGELALLRAALGRGAAALILGSKGPGQSAVSTAAGLGHGSAALHPGDAGRGRTSTEASAARDAPAKASGEAAATAGGALLPELSQESHAYLLRHGLLPGGA